MAKLKNILILKFICDRIMAFVLLSPVFLPLVAWIRFNSPSNSVRKQ